MKERYPWRFGVTSFVLPNDILTNVRFAADKVDDVQLLFFESASNSRLEHPLDIPALQNIAAAHQLTYTVHLPTDIRLGAAEPKVRDAGMHEIERLVDELSPINPLCYDLHLVKEVGLADEAWQTNLEGSFEQMAAKLGDIQKKICIENIDYPLEKVNYLIDKYGFGTCLDFGHAQKYAQSWKSYLETYFSRTSHIHLHGLQNGKDHQAITGADIPLCRAMGQKLFDKQYAGVMTLELYSQEQVRESMTVLQEAWSNFDIHEKER